MLLPYQIPNLLEAGCDEAGRGPLAGSVFAAAVILPTDISLSKDPMLEILNDSKQLTEHQRLLLKPWIESVAVSCAVAEVTTQEIDKINILNAAILAMQRALAQLHPQPEHIIVDGNKWKPYVKEGDILETPANTVVKGDAMYLSIAAASILAKTYRDEYMCRLDREYPMYHWRENKGYPTQAHYEALRQFGPSPYHRMTFNLSK